MFETLLKLFGEVSTAIDYYDQIKIISQEIETLEWLLTPMQFTNITHFDPNVHKIDQEAKVYLQKAALDVQKMVPTNVIADGNCLYNSVTCLNETKLLTTSELRVRTLIEFVKNEFFYSNRYSHIIGPLDEAMKNIARNFSFSELYEIVGLSNVLKCNIRSIYPRIGYREDLHIMNSTFEYAQSNLSSNTIFIFWTHTRNEVQARNSNSGNWTPNHFVPLLFSSDNVEFQNNPSQSQVISSEIIPTKSTTKNNIVTTVRIPEFNLADDEQQLLQTSETVFPATSETSLTPRTKRRQYSAENITNTEITNVDNQRILARQRMAAKRAEATQEAVEQQRIHARQRSAARRATMASKEIQQQRTITRERNATTRAALTQEEADRQRTLARERSAARRATMTSEEADRQRTLARERSAARRATMTPEEADRQRTLARKRSAARRAIMTSEEIQQERKTTRARNATTRATLTPKEVEQYRKLAAERTLVSRATVSPRVAEEERILARKRSAARRAAYKLEEAEQQREAARRSRHLSKILKNKQRVSKTGVYKNIKVEWPKAIDMECKTNCLKKFIQQMSMSSLAEGVCGICNVRCYKRDLRHVPVNKIPSIELLRTHEDLCNVIPDTQRIKKLYSNEMYNVNNDLDSSTVGDDTVLGALQWLKQNNPLYRSIVINRSIIDKLPDDDDVPECLLATMQISTNVEASENERASYIPDPLLNVSDSSDTTAVPLIPSAVLDVNGTNISSDDMTEHLLERMKVQIVEKAREPDSERNAQENTVYTIPRGNRPTNEYSNPNLLLGIFSTLFPYGCGAIEDCSRPVKIDFREHVRYLLSFGDHRFEEHYSFIFVVFNILQRRTACFHAHLMTSRPYFQQSAHLLESLSSADIATALVNISKGTYSKVADQRINTLMKHIKIVGGHVMGSSHSRSALRTKIHSLCFYLGLPSLFVTINPADIHSPVPLYFAGVDLDLDKILPEALGTSYERVKTIATHPVATAKFFNCLIKTILKSLVLGGVLGPTKAYFGTVENQGRGSLHLHLLIWLNHEFTPTQLKQQIQNEDFRQKLVQYLEDIIKEDLDQFRNATEQVEKEVAPACLPTPNPSHVDFRRIVETSNIHKHSATCYKYSKEKPDGLKSCRMRMPRVLVKNSSIDTFTGQITMRRSHPWINNFNEWLISACRSNMDIKFIWTGNDAKALVYYITDYVTKSSLAFYDMFALAQNVLNPSSSNNRCYNMIASHQEVSGVQVASYLMNYGDHYTTHTFKNLFLISIEHYLQAELMKARLSEKTIDQEATGDMSTLFYEDREEEAKETEEQVLLEPTQTTNGQSYVMVNTRLDYQHRSKDLTALCLYEFVSLFHKKLIDKSDRRLLKNTTASEGQRLNTEGTKMNERHTFANLHPQSSSHILIKRANPVVPVLLGPQIPRREREDTRERYCRVLLTLFVPWRSVNDLCALQQTWSQALEVRKLEIAADALKIIENIQLLHECKNDRDEHLHQVIAEAQADIKIDPILIPSCYEDDENNPEDNPEELLQMLSLVDETTTKAYSASLSSPEQRYLFDALEAIDKTKRFGSLNDYKNMLNINDCHIADDFNTFTVAHSHHTAMVKEWKRDIEMRRDQARNYLISGEDSLEVRDDEMQVEVMTSEIPTSPSKVNTTVVPAVTATISVTLPTKSDIIRNFTLNTEQKFAFMIITSHLDGDSQLPTGTNENQLLMCVPGCGGTGKSQLIRAITNYFQATMRRKMLRKLAPTSIAAAEIDGLTIHSFLGESRKNSKKRQVRTFRPGDTKLENEWRHVKYLIIDEMSMLGLSLLARLNRIVKTAKHINTDVPFGGINVIFFGDYLQYSPVLDKPLYHSGTSTQQYTERQIEMQCAQKVISQINCVVQLEQQMRTEDTRYLELLNRLRDGKSTIEDYELLCTRVIGTPNLKTYLQQDPWNEAPILVFRNTLRTQINNRAVLNKATEMKLRPIICVAQDYVRNAAISDVRLRKAILELPDNKTEHLPGYLPLVPGMPVLLTENIATELGLSNGTRGIFRQLVYDEVCDNIQFDETIFPKHTKFITHPKYALVEFSSCKLDSGLRDLQTKIIPISVSEQTFLFDIKELLTETISKAAKKAKKLAKISIKRKALPLIPAYSMTTHKSQGQTLGKIIVDLVMPPGPVEVASVCVPLSRVKRLDDLLIVRSFELSSLQVKPTAAQLEELNRLDKIAKVTRKSFASIT
ncbi:unnamed protein product [Rotaria magnacalcarata]